MPTNLRLVKRHSKRKGFEGYTDLLLIYEYNGKIYDVRINPVFVNDYKKLWLTAEDLDELPQETANSAVKSS